MNENRDKPVEDVKDIVQTSFLVGAEQLDGGAKKDVGKWFGVFKLTEDAVTFVGAQLYDTEDEAIAWAAEAGQYMLFNSLLGLVVKQTSHRDDKHA